ncbi:cell growth-regulating nucleolar protein isoform X1 [Papio anubis]|uniref:Cell growth-regulating nucleolar protein n=1 Tax=Papio anubis TaxID=9555 RepID=A0A096NZE7_PAPAN|nr:cell growth-regulating nucleolar protein isoform X1 [Papio anubis]XP_031520581.1 cell growth-regulating nucleolar protein isoform X1 [Papio anubis]XP_031520582.1 cell growth-regulating nucleolar protein isoform X1 [Papio anubis]XP_031520583.1 cell growth-regulating nucleolar protein isoform X1 [Papio anubis]XP_031520584.1 cell growth-regulating nucleolar protein isoform X1 [Papio anubis]XP_031520585.1 cell growth-regulating nucleolar protein isoform X1 [Papio anubis]XP_031520586.1 cell gro
MVFFTCNACGESVKKIQVEKHVSVCRNCECLSCIDCGKDFWGDDYKNHVKCISEDQKYGGKGYEGKTHKGDIKQQAWIQKISELIKRPNVSPKVRELLEQISAFDNVPRKKAKFQNWMKNSLKVHNESILDQVWNIFSEASNSEPVSKEQDQQPLHPVANPRAEISTEVPPSKVKDAVEQQGEVKKNKRERKEERQKKRKREKKELKLENHQENSRNQKPKKRKKGQEADLGAGGEEVPEANGSAEKRSKKKKQRKDSAGEEEANVGAGKRKRRHSEVETDSKKKKMKLPEHPEGGEPEDHEATAKGKFNWKGTIKAILKQAPDNEITIKKLRKKVLAQYYIVTDEHHRSEEELLVIFNKKISKNPTFKLLKDKVKLVK